MTPADLGRPLNSVRFWRYRAICQHCHIVAEWAVDKQDRPDDYIQFQRYVTRHRFPRFIEGCEACQAMVVFELVAYSLSPTDASPPDRSPLA